MSIVTPNMLLRLTMQTKTEIINQITAKKQPDYEAFWLIFVHCVQNYMYYEHPETKQLGEKLIQDWIKKTAITSPVTVYEIYNEYSTGSWYYSEHAIYLNGVLNGVFVQRYKSDDKLMWRNEIAGMETIQAMFDMFKESVKYATSKEDVVGEEWLDEYECESSK